jgi:hypothetical protein
MSFPGLNCFFQRKTSVADLTGELAETFAPDALCRGPCAVGPSLIKCQYFMDPLFP